MKEIIKEEYEKFEKIYKGIDKRLKELILADIIASMMTEEEQIVKDEEGKEKTIKIKKYDEFDEKVCEIKELLQQVHEIPVFDLKDSIQSTLEQSERMKEEALISMRTLSWVKNDVIDKEDNDA